MDKYLTCIYLRDAMSAMLAWMKSGMKETIGNNTISTMETGNVSVMNTTTTTLMQTSQSMFASLPSAN